MTRFEPQISGVWGNDPTNWATIISTSYLWTKFITWSMPAYESSTKGVMPGMADSFWGKNNYLIQTAYSGKMGDLICPCDHSKHCVSCLHSRFFQMTCCIKIAQKFQLKTLSKDKVHTCKLIAKTMTVVRVAWWLALSAQGKEFTGSNSSNWLANGVAKDSQSRPLVKRQFFIWISLLIQFDH